VTAQDSYRGKLYFALEIGKSVEGFTKICVRVVLEAMSWILERDERDIWGNQESLGGHLPALTIRGAW
jgi:hypothetical protein